MEERARMFFFLSPLSAAPPNKTTHSEAKLGCIDEFMSLTKSYYYYFFFQLNMWRKRVLRYLKKPSVCGLGSMRSASAVTLSRLARGGFFFFPPSSSSPLPSRAPRAKWISFLFHIVVLQQLADSDGAAPRVFSQVFKFTRSDLFPAPDTTTCVCPA